MRRKPSAKKEMLTAYDRNLNSIGEYPRSEVHGKSMLHRTIRVWMVDKARDTIWFQKRSMSKSLFPGKYDPIATGHVDPGESARAAALRELREETGVDAGDGELIYAGDLPFPFERPDGKTDNELASVFVYAPEEIPELKTSDEVMGYASMRAKEYRFLLMIGASANADIYGLLEPDVAKKGCLETYDFCCLDEAEFALVNKALKSMAG